MTLITFFYRFCFNLQWLNLETNTLNSELCVVGRGGEGKGELLKTLHHAKMLVAITDASMKQ